jgi:hypothetical protein
MADGSQGAAGADDKTTDGSAAGAAAAGATGPAGAAAAAGSPGATGATPGAAAGATGAAGGTDDSGGAPSWPDDWREKAAKGDEKKLARLNRYASPEAAMDALFAAQAKISSGELKTALPKDATPEQVAEWRKANGIPEKATEYSQDLPDGYVIGDEDKPLADQYLEVAHAANMTPEQVQAGLLWFAKFKETHLAERKKLDDQQRIEFEERLRGEWGNDFRPNLTLVNNWLGGMPGNVKDKIYSARLPDGTALGNDPDFLRAFVGAAREINPIATVLPGLSGDKLAGVEEQIGKYEERMRTDRPGWFRDEKAQAHYRQLLDARDRLKK